MKVNFYATLRQIVGGKTVEVALDYGVTVQGLIDELLARYPALHPQLYDEHGQLYPHVHVFVNGRDAQHLDAGLDTPIAPGDTINIFPPVGGGCV
ncbi:MAG: MoaD/ThiS family protein [Chloroflexi bacterium]|nr:MoaD/ThiS family protein [Chloroflexota bacterium]